ncbi:MAG: CPBP family intramembrane metalloprotease [Bacteroidetes bacterium]|nr:MAG: CPBP family intramembrane metalloprotease [Bacteroidota bacterium]
MVQKSDSVNMIQLLVARLRESPWIGLFIGMPLCLICMQISVGGTAVVSGLMGGPEGTLMSEVLSGKLDAHPQGVLWFRAFMIISQCGGWGLSGLIMIWLAGETRTLLSLPAAKTPPLLPAALAMLTALPLVNSVMLSGDMFPFTALSPDVAQWIQKAETDSAAVLKTLMSDPGALAINLFIFALLPALCEEVFFRGFLQRQLARLMPPWAAIAVGALIFSFLHFQFYGFLARALLGLLLGYFLYRSDSLWPGILAHASFNGLSIVGMTLLAGRPDTAELFSETYRFPLLLVAASLALTLGMLRWFHRLSPSALRSHTL